MRNSVAEPEAAPALTVLTLPKIGSEAFPVWGIRLKGEHGYIAAIPKATEAQRALARGWQPSYLREPMPDLGHIGRYENPAYHREMDPQTGEPKTYPCRAWIPIHEGERGGLRFFEDAHIAKLTGQQPIEQIVPWCPAQSVVNENYQSHGYFPPLDERARPGEVAGTCAHCQHLGADRDKVFAVTRRWLIQVYQRLTVPVPAEMLARVGLDNAYLSTLGVTR